MKTGFLFFPPPRARKPCAVPLSLSFSAHHLRYARSVVLDFVMYGAFYEWNQYVLPLFCIFFRHATHRQPCALAHRHSVSAQTRPTMPRLGDADRVCSANRSIPPVSATPTAFAPQIGQFPTGEGWQKSLLSSAQALSPRPPIFFQRACRQCVHESARLSRVICSHAWYS